MAACWRPWALAPVPGTSSPATNTLAGMMGSGGAACRASSITRASSFCPGSTPLPGLTDFIRGNPAAVGRLDPALWLPAGPLGKLRRKPALQRHLLQGGQLDLRRPNSRPRQTGEATPPSLCAKTNLALSLAPSLPQYPLRLSPYSTSASRLAGSLRPARTVISNSHQINRGYKRHYFTCSTGA